MLGNPAKISVSARQTLEKIKANSPVKKSLQYLNKKLHRGRKPTTAPLGW